MWHWWRQQQQRTKEESHGVIHDGAVTAPLLHCGQIGSSTRRNFELRRLNRRRPIQFSRSIMQSSPLQFWWMIFPPCRLEVPGISAADTPSHPRADSHSFQSKKDTEPKDETISFFSYYWKRSQPKHNMEKLRTASVLCFCCLAALAVGSIIASARPCSRLVQISHQNSEAMLNRPTTNNLILEDGLLRGGRRRLEETTDQVS
jgi:hypothetical protein